MSDARPVRHCHICNTAWVEEKNEEAHSHECQFFTLSLLDARHGHVDTVYACNIDHATQIIHSQRRWNVYEHVSWFREKSQAGWMNEQTCFICNNPFDYPVYPLPIGGSKREHVVRFEVMAESDGCISSHVVCSAECAIAHIRKSVGETGFHAPPKKESA